MNYEHTSELHRLRTLHLFAGAGGGILADILLGHQPVCAVEIEPYCQQVLHARQKDGFLPWFPIFDDVKTFDGKPWRGLVEVVAGGFPCQDISAAGRGAGIGGARSGLWGEMARVVCEVQPRYVFVENSPMLTIRGLGAVLGDLASMGYDARWGVLGADAVGLDHHRSRIWLVANSAERRRQKCEPYREEKGNIGVMGEGQKPGKNPEWRKAEPAMVGMGDVLAYRVDKLFAIGNGQVSAVAALAWRTLSEGII
jgi:DNA (cytosine-5)-methyltransferase 1